MMTPVRYVDGDTPEKMEECGGMTALFCVC
jgi:hypothetical protein